MASKDEATAEQEAGMDHRAYQKDQAIRLPPDLSSGSLEHRDLPSWTDPPERYICDLE